MLQGGYIKLHRAITQWEWYDDVNVKVVFLHLLLTVNHFDQNWHGKVIKRGQRAVSVADLADELNLTVSQIRTAIGKLESTKEIARSKIGKIGLISVLNYDKYQDESQRDSNVIATSSQDGRNVIATKKEYKESKNIFISSIAPAVENKLTTARTREGLVPLNETYEKYFGNLPRIAVEEFEQALSDGMEPELVRKIIEETAAAGAKSPVKYMRSIIDRCKRDAVLTAEQFAKAKERGAVPGRGAGHVAKRSYAAYDLSKIQEMLLEDEE